MTLPLSQKPIASDVTRVMIVDDSAVIRGLIARVLDTEPDIEVSVTVSDGRQAVAALARHPVDVIVLDIEMPEMDGLTAIPLLLAKDPHVKIVMASTLTLKNADITLKALAAGAADYIPKPTSSRDMMGPAAFNRELVEKVRSLGAVARQAKPGPHRVGSAPAAFARATAAPPVPQGPLALRAPSTVPPQVIAIGSSTGGPQALYEVLKNLAPASPLPIMLTQHMPPTFTTMLATHITRLCGITAVEAEDGMPMQKGRVHIAPGNYHMTVSQNKAAPIIRLNQDPPQNYCRPSVDPMLASLVELYGPAVFAVILTGMGQDGLVGCRQVVAAGGTVIAQDKATSVVWGMPGAVSNAGICSAIMPIGEIGPRLKKLSSGRP